MRRIVVPLLVPTVVVAVASCRDPAPDHAVDGPAATVAQVPSTTTTAAPPADEEPTGPAPATPESDEEAIITAVLGYWDAVIAAGVSGDSSELSSLATGEALAVSLKRTDDLVLLGQSLRPPDPSERRHTPVVVEITGDTATVLDCSVDDTIIVDRASGRVLNDLVQTNEWLTTVRRIDGAWKVDGNVLQAQWEGVAGCAG